VTLLKEFLDSVKPSDEVEKIRMLCDKIQLEEIPNYKNPDVFGVDQPKGVNVFLTLFLKNGNFICLEREFKDQFVVKIFKGKFLVQSHHLNETVAEKVLHKFATILKHENGE
jgi:hypothetical protein